MKIVCNAALSTWILIVADSDAMAIYFFLGTKFVNQHMPRPAGSYRHSRQHETLEVITISGYFGWNLITVFCFFLFMARSCEGWK